jgi:transposase
MARFDRTDAEWVMIAPLLPDKPRGDDRRVLNGIFWTLRTGSPWRDRPERYGPYTTVDNRYNRWAKAGVWLPIFERLAERSAASLHLHRLLDHPRPSARRRRKKGGPDHAIGCSRGGLSTKIHAVESMPSSIAMASRFDWS